MQLFGSCPAPAGIGEDEVSFVPDFDDIDVSENGRYVPFGPYLLDQDADSGGILDIISSIDTFDGNDGQSLTLAAAAATVDGATQIERTLDALDPADADEERIAERRFFSRVRLR